MRTFAAVVLLLLIVTFCVFTAAAENVLFYVSPDGEWTAQAITLTEVKNKTFLFLPGNMDKSSLKIRLNNGAEAVLNGKPFTGEETAADLLENNSLTVGGKTIQFRVMQGSKDLPALYITTDTGSMKKVDGSKKYKEAGWLTMICGSGGKEYDGPLEHIKLRGNASTRYTKKNYQIKLEKSMELLGMGKAKKWILTGNWLDESFIRNEMTYDLAEYIGMPYTPERQQAELYINHEYHGLYLFSEKIEIKKSRVNITDLEEATEILNSEKLPLYKPVTKKLSANAFYKAYSIPNNPEDITGGYIIEYEFQKSRYETEPSYYRTKRKRGLIIKSPEYVAMHKITTNKMFTVKRITELYFEGLDLHELTKKFPFEARILKYYDWQISEMKFKIENMMIYARHMYEEYDHDRKAVAKTIGGDPFSWAGFKAIGNDKTVDDMLAILTPGKMEKYIKEYEI